MIHKNVHGEELSHGILQDKVRRLSQCRWRHAVKMYTSLKYLVVFEDDLFDLLFVRNLPPTEELQFPRYIIQQLSTVCNFGCSTMYQCNCSGYSRGGTLTIPAIGLEDPPFGTCTIFTMHCIIHIFHHNHQNCHYLCDHHQRHYHQHQ